MKLCSKCKQIKHIDEFHKDKNRKDGLQYRCKSCMIELNRQRYKAKSLVEKRKMQEQSRRKKKLLQQEVNQYKHKHGCKYCLERDPCCLDFHHPTDNKEYSVSKLVTAKSPKLWEEISKCEVVCANCHRKIHAGQKLTEVGE